MKTDQHIQSKSQRYENVPSNGCCFFRSCNHRWVLLSEKGSLSSCGAWPSVPPVTLQDRAEPAGWRRWWQRNLLMHGRLLGGLEGGGAPAGPQVWCCVSHPKGERRSPQHLFRPRHTLDGAKMRASVRMTRYLESWGAAKPFAHLHHRDSMTTENGKISTTVRPQRPAYARSPKQKACPAKTTRVCNEGTLLSLTPERGPRQTALRLSWASVA